MAARVEPARVQAAHQSLHHFVAKAEWSDKAVLAEVRAEVLPAIERQGAIRAWIVDDTGFPKKGKHSVGVARQYCGQLGKQDNCQIAVSLSVANDHASLPIAYRLYLPEDWANDAESKGQGRRSGGYRLPHQAARSPSIRSGRRFRLACRTASCWPTPATASTPPSERLDGDGLDLHRRHPVLGAACGRRGCGPLPPKAWSGRGRPPSLLRRDREHKPVSAKELAQSLPESAWRSVAGAKAPSAALTRASPRSASGRHIAIIGAPAPGRGMVPGRVAARREAADQILALNLAAETRPSTDLVETAKLRWRIERDYQELKQEIGLGHYEGRGWRGFHHHATLAIAAYGFLVSERSLIPPSGHAHATLLKAPRLPKGYRPRGSPAPTRTPRRQLDRHHPH